MAEGSNTSTQTGISIEVGSVISGLPGTPAQVTNSGTPEHAVLNFVLPQGIPGEQGPQGLEGIQGPDGPKGTNGKGISGIQLTVNADNAITGGTVTYTDGTTGPVSVKNI